MSRVRFQAVLLSLLVIPGTLSAVGTKKKRQKIHVRREFVSPFQATLPVETHADSNVHALYCKGTGIEKCGWKFPPRLYSREYSLEGLDSTVSHMIKNIGGQFTFQASPDLAIHVRRFSNGYEYVIEEGYPLTPQKDSVGKGGTYSVRETPAEWRSGKTRRPAAR